MSVQYFEKLQHIPVNIEGRMHVQGHMHPKGEKKSSLIVLVAQHEPLQAGSEY